MKLDEIDTKLLQSFNRLKALHFNIDAISECEA